MPRRDVNSAYQNAAELLANLTRQPIVSDLVYETLDAIIAAVAEAQGDTGD